MVETRYKRHNDTAPLLGHTQRKREYQCPVKGCDICEFSFSSLTRRKKLIFVLCIIANLFSNIGHALPAAFYPHEAEKKGVSTAVIGIIFAVFHFIIFVASPIVGKCVYPIGSKFMLATGICLGGFFSISFGLLYLCPSGAPFIVLSVVFRSLEALGFTAFSTANIVVLASEFQIPDHFQSVCSINEFFSKVGLITGPIIGAALYQAGGFGLPFYVIGSIVLVNGFILSLALPMTSDFNLPTHPRRNIFQSRLVVIVFINIVVASTGMSFLNPIFANHLEKLNLSTVYIGLMFLIIPGLYAFLAPFWRYLQDKGIKAPLMIIGNMLCGIGFFLIGPSEWLTFVPFELWVVILGTLLAGLSFGCTLVPTMKKALTGAIEVGFDDNDETYAVIQGLSNSGYYIGSFVGPLLGGLLTGEIGFQLSVSIIGIVYLSMMIINLIYFSIRTPIPNFKFLVIFDLLIH